MSCSWPAATRRAGSTRASNAGSAPWSPRGASASSPSPDLDHSLLERTSHDRVAELLSAYVAQRAADALQAQAAGRGALLTESTPEESPRDRHGCRSCVLASDACPGAGPGPGTGPWAEAADGRAGKGIEDDDDSGSAPVPKRGLANAFGKRQLSSYPNTWPRLGYLAIVVLTTIMLYYLYYVEGAVTPLLLPYYHMSFQFFLYLLVVSNAIGAFSAFIGGSPTRSVGPTSPSTGRSSSRSSSCSPSRTSTTSGGSPRPTA